MKFDEEIKKHKHFSKVDKNTWLVQSDPKSKCQAYFVTVLPHAIVMYGDYSGVIVKPHECGNTNLINWMANATSLNYFAEKVVNGNRYHQVKEWYDDLARKEFAEMLEGYDYEFREGHGFYDEGHSSTVTKLDVNIIKKILNDDARASDYEHLSKARYLLFKAVEDTMHFDNQHDFIEALNKFFDKIGSDRDYEWYSIGEDYTHQLKWQHKCLLWWANNVLDASKNPL